MNWENQAEKTFKKTTINDVARIAGVSSATVSRVINGTASVRPQKIQAVQKAIKTTGFQISTAAQNLARGKSNAYAVVLTEPINELLTDPTFAAIFQGVLQELSQTSVTPLLLLSSTHMEQEKTLRLFERKAADAIIHLSPYTDDLFLEELATLNLPVVLCGKPRKLAPSQFSMIYADDKIATMQAGKFLISKGSQKILAILGPENNPATIDRLDGYKAVLGSMLLPSVFYGSWATSHGYTAAKQAFRQGLTFDTVVAGNDRIAAGVLAAAQEINLNIPKDLKILGFDNHPIAIESIPQISTISSPFYEQGTQAVKLAQELTEGGSPKTQLLETTIIDRETT